MERSLSGKFKKKQVVSTFVAEDKGDSVNDTVGKIGERIPMLPDSRNAIAVFLEEYFGRFWWLWLVLLVILKNKKV